MTEQEYLAKKRVLQSQHNAAIKTLNLDYAIKNNPYKIGDILKDHYQIGKVTGMQVSFTSSLDLPQMVYHCTILNKDLTETKSKNNKTQIWQQNVIEKLN